MDYATRIRGLCLTYYKGFIALFSSKHYSLLCTRCGNECNDSRYINNDESFHKTVLLK